MSAPAAPPPPAAPSPASPPVRPGDFGAYDPTFIARHTPWLHRLIHTYFRAKIEGFPRTAEGICRR